MEDIFKNNKFVKVSPSTSPENNLKLSIKTEPVTVGADATEYVWFLSHISLWLRLHQVGNTSSRKKTKVKNVGPTL